MHVDTTYRRPASSPARCPVSGIVVQRVDPPPLRCAGLIIKRAVLVMPCHGTIYRRTRAPSTLVSKEAVDIARPRRHDISSSGEWPWVVPAPLLSPPHVLSSGKPRMAILCRAGHRRYTLTRHINARRAGLSRCYTPGPRPDETIAVALCSTPSCIRPAPSHDRVPARCQQRARPVYSGTYQSAARQRDVGRCLVLPC